MIGTQKLGRNVTDIYLIIGYSIDNKPRFMIQFNIIYNEDLIGRKQYHAICLFLRIWINVIKLELNDFVSIGMEPDSLS